MASLPLRVGAPLAVAAASLLPGTALAATAEPSPPAIAATVNAATATTVLDNPFFPDDTATNLTDCVSALPRPECGSKERGGWRQGVVFGVVVAGLAAVGLRLGLGIRRRDRE
jgi:hypothetical protein